MPAWGVIAIKIAAVLTVIALIVGGGLWLALHQSGSAVEGRVENRQAIEQNRERIEQNSTKINGTLRCLSRARDPQSCIDRVAGPKGPGGASGSTGRMGARGARGGTGARGRSIIGRRGPQGPAGRPGPQGPKGEPGENAAQPANGVDGINGEDGTQGLKGTDGRDGRDAGSFTFTDATGLKQLCPAPDVNGHSECAPVAGQPVAP